jgi:hypothetical protein
MCLLIYLLEEENEEITMLGLEMMSRLLVNSELVVIDNWSGLVVLLES